MPTFDNEGADKHKLGQRGGEEPHTYVCHTCTKTFDDMMMWPDSLCPHCGSDDFERLGEESESDPPTQESEQEMASAPDWSEELVWTDWESQEDDPTETDCQEAC